MPPATPRWQRRIAAAEAALSLLDEQGVNQARQIDVFGLCEQLGLWLAFVPLDNVLGAFVPEGSGGVLINTQRPLTVQRYTAAHELGHFRMDHGPTADAHVDVFGRTHAEREQLAQIFAGNIVMPPPLVFSILEAVRPSADTRLSPRDCYLLAREAGVSYEAAIWQLVNLEIVTRGEATELFRTRPLAIKTDLAYGRRPVNGWADVWGVDEGWDDEILGVHVDDEAVISLPENRSTGYRWMLADAREPTLPATDPPAAFGAAPNPENLEDAQAGFLRQLATAQEPAAAPGPVMRELRRRVPPPERPPERSDPHVVVDVVGDDYLTSRMPSVRDRDAREARLDVAQGDAPSGRTESWTVAGTTGRRLLGVRFGLPGMHTVRLVYRSPYVDGPDVRTYAIHAMVETRRTGISVNQLVTEEDDEEWVTQVRERQATATPAALDPDDPALTE